jgi:hypothetical protein
MANQLWFGQNEHHSTTEQISYFGSLIGFCSGLTEHRIPAQQKAD